MTVETATSIAQLDTTLPTAADMISEGDDHIRLLKTALKGQFPNLGTTAVTPTAADLNKVGITQSQTDYSTAVASTVYVTDKVIATLNNSVLGSIALSGATKFAAGAYTEGDCVWSPVSYQTYRAKSSGTFSTDPNSDAANWALLTSGVASLTPTAVTSVAAVPGCLYVLTSGSAATVTLPASPVPGDPPIYVMPANGLLNNVIARNGNLLMGLAEDMTLDAPLTTIGLRFINSTVGWRFV